MGKLDYNKIDLNIRDLVQALNSFDGIETFGSCGGHADPEPGAWSEESWYIKFNVRRDDHGWRALEFLAWLFSDMKKAGGNVILFPYAPPPYRPSSEHPIGPLPDSQSVLDVLPREHSLQKGRPRYRHQS